MLRGLLVFVEPGVEVAAADRRLPLGYLMVRGALSDRLPAKEGRFGYVEFGEDFGEGEQLSVAGLAARGHW